MYHWDRQLASKCARECLDLFDASPNTEGHHRISLELLSSSGRWRAEVEQVANGTSVLVLSIAFLKRSMQLGLAPVVERAMEARHAYVSNRIRIGKKKKKRGATTVSLASGRMTELKERARVNPHFAEVMGRHLQVMRNPRRALEALGLIHHPRVANLCRVLTTHERRSGKRLPHSTALYPGLIDIMYRLVGADQFRSTATASKAHSKQVLESARLQAQCKRSVQQPRCVESRDGRVHDLLQAHLIEECQKHGPGYMFSLQASGPMDSKFLTCLATLEDHLNTGVGQACRRGAMVQNKRSAVTTLQAADAFGEELEEAFNEDAQADVKINADVQSLLDFALANEPDECSDVVAPHIDI